MRWANFVIFFLGRDLWEVWIYFILDMLGLRFMVIRMENANKQLDMNI